MQDRLGTASGQSLDRYVWLPLPAYERIFGAPETLQVFARARDVGLTGAAEDRTRTTMRARRRLRPGQRGQLRHPEPGGDAQLRRATSPSA